MPGTRSQGSWGLVPVLLVSVVKSLPLSGLPTVSHVMRLKQVIFEVLLSPPQLSRSPGGKERFPLGASEVGSSAAAG